MKIAGKDYSKEAVLKRIGNIQQIGGAKKCVLDDGLAKGISTFEVKTGGGLNYSVLPDRAMDISFASFNNINLAYSTCNGETNGKFYEPEGIEWLRTFAAGLLTTCGLTHIGGPATIDGESWGLHGRVSTLPAKQVCDNSHWDGDDYKIVLSGIIEEGRLFGDKIRLTRTISSIVGENKIFINDKIENFGFKKSPFSILYHINAGFPLLDENTNLIVDAKSVEPRNDHAKTGMDSILDFTKPIAGYEEMCYFHEMNADENGFAKVSLINKRLDIGLSIKFNQNELPYLTEWKMMGEGEYVVGIEPCNLKIKDRQELIDKNLLPYLLPGEIKNINIEIAVENGVNTRAN